MNIRPATSADIPAMMMLERNSSAAAHWAEQQYQQLFLAASREMGGGVERLVLVAQGLSCATSVSGIGSETESGVAGFLVARRVGPEWELENVVVAAGDRRKGLGKRLLGLLLDRARETNCEAVFLEVRDSNAAARALYEKVGFRVSGHRRGYYADPAEDAVLYSLALSRAISS